MTILGCWLHVWVVPTLMLLEAYGAVFLVSISLPPGHGSPKTDDCVRSSLTGVSEFISLRRCSKFLIIRSKLMIWFCSVGFMNLISFIFQDLTFWDSIFFAAILLSQNIRKVQKESRREYLIKKIYFDALKTGSSWLKKRILANL